MPEGVAELGDEAQGVQRGVLRRPRLQVMDAASMDQWSSSSFRAAKRYSTEPSSLVTR